MPDSCLLWHCYDGRERDENNPASQQAPRTLPCVVPSCIFRALNTLPVHVVRTSLVDFGVLTQYLGSRLSASVSLAVPPVGLSLPI